jgi:asparagine synthase (glutamine-hydrolysing)
MIVCGIVGGWVDAAPDQGAIERALGVLRHRGPDDQGLYINENAFLGIRRLSIIDLETGHQPVFNEDGSVAVVLNGEIYNYLELRQQLIGRGHQLKTKGDTEVIVHLYEERGLDLCRELNGQFAFGLWDSNEHRLVLGRDRFGQMPLYTARTDGGGVLFASEIKALRQLAPEATGWPIRPQAVYDFLSLGVVPQPTTIYEGVEMLPPASHLVHEKGRSAISTYWELEGNSEVSLSLDDATEGIRSRLGHAVQLRLRSDVPVGVFLSGGLDSSAVLYEAAAATTRPLQAFTVGVEDADLDESAVASRTAKAMGVDVTVLEMKLAPQREIETIVRHFDQPFADSSAIPSLAISRLAREHVTVVLNGDGGDECLAGYRRHLAAHVADRLPASVTSVLSRLKLSPRPRRSRLGFAGRFLRGLGQDPATRYLMWTTDMLLERDKAPVWSGGWVSPTEDWVAAQLEQLPSGLRGQLAADRRINLLSDLLVKMDMASMAHSIEARSPFLDHELAEFAERIPSGALVRGGTTKAVLRRAYRGRLPTEVIKAPKRGFEVPVAKWLRSELRPLLMDTVVAPDARIGCYLDRRLVSDIVEGTELQDRNWAYLVYSFLILELWLRDQTMWSTGG